MTITRHAALILRGLSTDSKPEVNILTNTLFIETNTRLMFLWDGAVWNPIVGTGTGGGTGSGGSGGSMRAGGLISFNGDAINPNFTINHGMGMVPDIVTLEPASIDALGDYIVTKSSTTLQIQYMEPPPAGPPGNVKFEYGCGMALSPASNNAGMSAGGVYAVNGDSSNVTFAIAHGLTPIPQIAHVVANSVDARGAIDVTITATHVIATYAVPPPTGTGNNVRLLWSAGYAGTASEGFSPGSTTTLTNKTIGDQMSYVKLTTAPTDPNIEVGVIYFKQIDANNNGFFVKQKEQGVIVERRLTPG